MKIIVSVVVWLVLLDLICMLSGQVLVKWKKTHRAGLRLLSMSLFYPKWKITAKCKLNCETDRCGNWSCGCYSYGRKVGEK